MGVAGARRIAGPSAAVLTAGPPRPDGAAAPLRPGPVPPTVVYVAADAAAMTLALVVAHLLRFGVSAALLPGPNVPYVLVAALSVPVWLGVLALARCYDRRILGVGSDEYRRVLNGGVHFLAVVALLHFLGRLVIARGYVGVLIPVALVATLLTRFALRAWLYRQRRRGRYVHRLLLVGTPATVVDVGEHLARSAWSGLLLVGAYVDTDAPALVIAGRSVPVVGGHTDLRQSVDVCGRLGGHHVGVGAGRAARAGRATLAGTDVDLLVAPAIADVVGPRTVVRDLGGLPLLHVEAPDSPAHRGWPRRSSTASAPRSPC